MSTYRAFLAENDNNLLFEVTYYHNPNRWIENEVEANNSIRLHQNWSDEIKYLNDTNDNVSDSINMLPTNTGGIYIFYIKGLNLSFIENYIVYIGRCKITQNQNIRKRAKEYFSDNRPQITRLFKHWKQYIYYRYYPETNNDLIDSLETKLIRSILPPLNEKIPDRIEIQNTVPAFR